MSYM